MPIKSMLQERLSDKNDVCGRDSIGLNWRAAKCKENGRGITKFTWMGDIYLSWDRQECNRVLTLYASRSIKDENKNLHCIWLCGLRSHLHI